MQSLCLTHVVGIFLRMYYTNSPTSILFIHPALICVLMLHCSFFFARLMQSKKIKRWSHFRTLFEFWIFIFGIFLLLVPLTTFVYAYIMGIQVRTYWVYVCNIMCGKLNWLEIFSYTQRCSHLSFLALFGFADRIMSGSFIEKLSKILGKFEEISTRLWLNKVNITISATISNFNFTKLVLTRWRNSLSDSRSSWRRRILSWKERE